MYIIIQHDTEGLAIPIDVLPPTFLQRWAGNPRQRYSNIALFLKEVL